MSGFLSPFFGPVGPDIRLVGYKYDDWASANAQRVISFSEYELEEGDFIVANLYIDQPEADDNLQPVTADYVEQVERYDVGTIDASFGVYTKVMGSSPDTDITIQATSASGGNDKWWSVKLSIWRNVDPSNPLDVALVSGGAAGSGQATSPAITPVSTGAVVVDMFASNVGNSLNLGAHANPGAYLPFHSHTSGKHNLGFAAKRWTGGTLGPHAHGGGSGGTTCWEAAQLALRPKLVPIVVESDLTFMSSLVHWWDINQGLGLSGSNVQSWIDRIAWQLMFPAGTPPVYSSTAFGGAKKGINALTMPGLHANVSLTGDNTWSLILVSRMQNAGVAWGRCLSAGNTGVGGDEGSTSTVTLVRNSSTTNMQIFRNGSGSSNFNAGYTNTHIHEICLDGTNTKYYADGSLVGSVSGNANLNVNRLGIFREIASSGQEDGRGTFGDLLVVNRALTAGERTELVNYLTAKFI